MRSAPSPGRPGLSHPVAAAARTIGPTAAKIRGGGLLVLLAAFVWFIFLMNLPVTSRPPTAPAFDRFLKLIMIAACLGVIAKHWSLARLLVKNLNPGLSAMILLVPLSALWSIDSPATLVRFVTLASMALVCFAIALVGWDRQRVHKVLLPPMMYVMVLSLIVGVVNPDAVIHIGDDLSLKDAWHGITYNKNQFGMMASQAVILCMYRFLAKEGKSIWSLVGVVAAFACLVLSRSNTSQFATFIGVVFMFLVMRVPVVKQRFSTHVVVGIAAILLVYELVILDIIPGVSVLLKPIMSLTGKDTTLSARTIIWEVIKQHASYAPWLGTGYGAYWPLEPTPSSPSYIFMYLMYFYPTEAHNGYLEIKNDLGYAGLACVLLFLFWYVRQALELMRFDRNQAALYLALLYHQMVMNMSESEWFARSSTFTVLILATTCLSRALVEYRRQARPAATVQPARPSRRGAASRHFLQ